MKISFDLVLFGFEDVSFMVLWVMWPRVGSGVGCLCFRFDHQQIEKETHYLIRIIFREDEKHLVVRRGERE